MPNPFELPFADLVRLFGLALALVGAGGTVAGIVAAIFRPTMAAVTGTRWRSTVDPKGDPILEALAWSGVALILGVIVLGVSVAIGWAVA